MAKWWKCLYLDSNENEEYLWIILGAYNLPCKSKTCHQREQQWL